MSRVQIEIFLGTLLIAITGAILLFVGIKEEERMAQFGLYQKAQLIEVGVELFEINCRGCHGLRGEGVPGLAPPLSDSYFFTQRINDVGWQGSIEDYIFVTISSGRQVSTRPDQFPGAGSPAMPTWSERFGGPLRDDQIEALAAFISNWESTALGDVEITILSTSTPSAEQLEDPVARGQKVFENNGCGGCHTIEGLYAGVVGPPLTKIAEVASTRVEGVSAGDYIRKSITNPSSFIVEGYDDLMSKTFADSISSSEIDDLIAFLSAQK